MTARQPFIAVWIFKMEMGNDGVARLNEVDKLLPQISSLANP
jgi:hypothetical protein